MAPDAATRYPRRLDAIREEAAKNDAGAALVSYLPHVRWACGFSGSNALLLVTETGAVLVTDGRYRDQAAAEVHGADVVVATDKLSDALGEGARFRGVEKLVVQADHLSVSRYRRFEAAGLGVRLVPVESFLSETVARKDASELDCMRRAQAITDQVFGDLLPSIRPGVTERELAAEIIGRQRRLGAEREPFEPIVASGPNAALPHARPTDRAIRDGDLVLLDFGCVVEGYASDMTRTVAAGDPGDEARDVYRIVLAAQQAALGVVRSGLAGSLVDAAARDVITEAGYGKAFSHSLGHGVGMDVHEWPRLSSRAEHVLPEGVVVTIEPGIYVPGRLGVRIEDMVYLGAARNENLTHSPKALIVLS